MSQFWKEDISRFLELAATYEVKMLMVGGGAVNFHGYQRHSADVDFWIKTEPENLDKLIQVFKKMGFEIQSFPKSILDQNQNISIKFSPEDLDLELITRFEIGKSFDDAFKEALEIEIQGNKLLKWKVLSFDDLIESKRRAGRPKDFLDIDQLNRNNGD